MLAPEVIDPRTLVLFDTETIVESVRKTGRILAVDEAYPKREALTGRSQRMGYAL
jgi:pyruvate/2-oxoglutarate/acetoin dehydrogenase E1 component